MEKFRRLSLVIASLVEPNAVEAVGHDESVWVELIESLKPGLGHLYKQLRVELARTVYMLLRAAPMAGCGLEVAAEQLRGWLVEAGRLLPLLLAGNAAVTHAR